MIWLMNSLGAYGRLQNTISDVFQLWIYTDTKCLYELMHPMNRPQINSAFL